MLSVVPLLPALAGATLSYRAAVVELASVVPDGGTLHASSASGALVKRANAALIDQWATKAAANGSKIVVFCEEFGSSAAYYTASTVKYVSEPLPEASGPDGPSLCGTDPSVLPFSSMVACTARRLNVTIVSGMTDAKPCGDNLSPFTQRPFPCDAETGLASYNTAVAFGPKGQLLAKYHKSHLARTWSKESEPANAEWAPIDPVTFFDPSTGVTFGLFICNDVNFGSPARALLAAGVRDIIFPTFWISGGAPWMAVTMQDAFSRAHGVNFLAANTAAYGRMASGSGIWPADLAAESPQHFPYGLARGDGWLGVADLTVQPPDATPLPPAVPLPKNGTAALGPFVGNATYFSVSGPSKAVPLRQASVGEHISCAVDGVVAKGAGDYALVAIAGLNHVGMYEAMCVVVPCAAGTAWTACVGEQYAPREVAAGLPRGGAAFAELRVQARAPNANTWHHSALCDDGLTPRPRTALQLDSPSASTRLSALRGAACPLMTMWVSGHAESEAEGPTCPFGKAPCSTDEASRARTRATAFVDALKAESAAPDASSS